MWQQIVEGWLKDNKRPRAFLAQEAGLDTSWMYLTMNGRSNAGPKSLRKLEIAMIEWTKKNPKVVVEIGTLSQLSMALVTGDSG